MLKQNTPEWEEWRKNKIGASDAPVIMGVSPYQTPYQLWEEKLDIGYKKQTTLVMEKGHEMEDRAREALQMLTGINFQPDIKKHSSLPWMIASLDGIDEEGKQIAELKFANKEDYQLAISGKVPEKHYPQLQHQLEVCGLEMAIYFSFNGEKGAMVKVYRDEGYIKNMLKRETEFWEKLQSWSPPELTDKDYIKKEDENSLHVALQLKQIQEELKKLEKKEKALRELVIEKAEHRNCIIGDLKVTKVVRRGAVDYSAIPQLKNIDLESYRKDSSEFFKITTLA